MTYRGIIFGLMVCVPLLGCTDSDRNPDDIPVYDDPSPTYVPPSFDGVESKSDAIRSAPTITQVEWSPVGSCNSRRVSKMRVVVTVEDPDTASADLSFEGSVSGCSLQGRDFGPVLQNSRTEILCHHVSVHNGLIMVADPEGNGDSAFFQFGPCESGNYIP